MLPVFTGSTAPAPTVSVSLGYLAVQRVESSTPERTEVWMLTVCARAAAEHAVDAGHVRRRVDRAAGTA